MRVFLDTNVIAGAVATRGLCADLFRHVLLAHDVVVSAPLLGELRRVLPERFGVGEAALAELEALLRQDCLMAGTGAAPDIRLADSDDPVILGSAIAGGAEVFVTGDKAVQAVGQVAGMRIVSPRGFWELLRPG